MRFYFRGQDIKYTVYQTKSKGQTWQAKDTEIPKPSEGSTPSLLPGPPCLSPKVDETESTKSQNEISSGSGEPIHDSTAEPISQENMSPQDSKTESSIPECSRWSAWRTSQSHAEEGNDSSERDSVTSDSSSDEDTDNDFAVDPGLYVGKRVTEPIIKLLLNRPYQPTEGFVFPKTDGRQCSRSCFLVILPDKSKQKRQWISYSVSRDRLYCLDCFLFGGPGDSAWALDGFNSWSNLNRDVQLHDTCPQHRAAERARITWLYGRKIDSQLSVLRAATVDSNRKAAFTAIKALQWLATEMCAIRGNQTNEGKFISLYKLLAEYDPAARAYLDKLDKIRSSHGSQKPEVNILSPRNIRRLINIMQTMVVQQSVETMKVQGICSLISDGTQDTSKLEACCVIIRYIEVDGLGVPRPVERTIGVFTTGETDGETLSKKILSQLSQYGVLTESIIGQSYDGAGNMSGKYTGLKTRIQQVQPKALYIWCKAHRLNLVIEATVCCCPEIRNAVGILQELHNFFNGHKRNAVLKKMQESEKYKRTLKRVADTTRSWRCVEDGVHMALQCFDAISDALENLATESTDSTTVSSAHGLLKRLDFGFIVCLHILRKVFQITGPCSRILQSTAADISIAAQLLRQCRQMLQVIRREEMEWQSVLKEAQQFAEVHGVNTELPVHRDRRPTKKHDERSAETVTLSSADHFRINVYYTTLDTVAGQIQERFHDDVIGIFQEMEHFTPQKLNTEDYVTTECITNLCNFYDLDPVVVKTELNEFRHAYRAVQDIVPVNDLIHVQGTKRLQTVKEHDAECDDDNEDSAQCSTGQWVESSFVKPLRVIWQLSGYPALTSLYKILVSLAVTSCSAERVMSRIRIVKNRLRSTMIDDWFSPLTLLACERDATLALKLDEIVDRLAVQSPALKKHLL